MSGQEAGRRLQEERVYQDVADVGWFALLEMLGERPGLSLIPNR
jgi:hypothetical protein